MAGDAAVEDVMKVHALAVAAHQQLAVIRAGGAVPRKVEEHLESHRTFKTTMNF